jgi:hypothetical protein
VVLLAVPVKVIPEPPVAKVDSASFDDFVGKYAWAGSSIVDTVTRKRDKLYIQSSYEDSLTELLPEKVDAFFTRERASKRKRSVHQARGFLHCNSR